MGVIGRPCGLILALLVQTYKYSTPLKKKNPKKVVHGLDWEAMQLDSDRNPFRYSLYLLYY
jgi:hypothetical protein